MYTLALTILYFGAPAIWFVCAAKLLAITLKLLSCTLYMPIILIQILLRTWNSLNNIHTRFEVLTAEVVKSQIISDVMLSQPVNAYRHSEPSQYLHLHGQAVQFGLPWLPDSDFKMLVTIYQLKWHTITWIFHIHTNFCNRKVCTLLPYIRNTSFGCSGTHLTPVLNYASLPAQNHILDQHLYLGWYVQLP